MSHAIVRGRKYSWPQLHTGQNMKQLLLPYIKSDQIATAASHGHSSIFYLGCHATQLEDKTFSQNKLSYSHFLHCKTQVKLNKYSS